MLSPGHSPTATVRLGTHWELYPAPIAVQKSLAITSRIFAIWYILKTTRTGRF